MEIIVPKRNVPVTLDYPMFYLAGPILGGGNWQEEAVSFLSGLVGPNITIICPCRWGSNHPLAGMFVKGVTEFPNQTLWERHFMQLVGTNPGVKGCLLFWVPKECKTNPRKDGNPYARDTYGELGEWRWRWRCDNARMVLGVEPGFPGRDVIERNFIHALGYKLVIHTTLAETVQAAIALCAQKAK